MSPGSHTQFRRGVEGESVFQEELVHDWVGGHDGSHRESLWDGDHGESADVEAVGRLGECVLGGFPGDEYREESFGIGDIGRGDWGSYGERALKGVGVIGLTGVGSSISGLSIWIIRLLNEHRNSISAYSP